MKRWTTDEQQDWLEGKANGFVQAQLDSDVGPYMSLVTSEWFEEFPDTMPSDEDVTKKELKKANFDMEVAKVEHKKNVSAIFDTFESNLTYPYLRSNYRTGFITYCATKKRREKGRKRRSSMSRLKSVPDTSILIKDISSCITHSC